MKKNIRIPKEKVELLVHSDQRILVKEYIQGIAVGFLLGFLVAWLWLA
jgi:hypothetical protein